MFAYDKDTLESDALRNYAKKFFFCCVTGQKKRLHNCTVAEIIVKFLAYLLSILTTGMIISSSETPPCWNVFL